MNRYDRQQKFKGIGSQGQQQIEQKTVCIVGLGALGTHTAASLARAGINKLILIDRDYVEWTNLQRQTLYIESDAQQLQPKAAAAAQHLKEIRSDIEIDTYIEHCDASLLEAALSSCNLIIDGTDNFAVRQTINDFCYSRGIPWIYGACVESTYAACPFIPGVTPCFNCMMGILPVMNRTCDTVGIIEPAAAMATSWQMMYALKLLSGAVFEPKLIYGDIWAVEHTAVKFSRMQQPGCPTCGSEPSYPYLKTSRADTMLCGRDTVQLMSAVKDQHEMLAFVERLQLPYQQSPYAIRFKFNERSILWFNGGRLLIHDVKTIKEAKTVYHQLFG